MKVEIKSDFEQPQTVTPVSSGSRAENKSRTEQMNPQPPKVTKFRVTIRQPEQWKVRAIAEYKQKQYLRKLEQRKQTAVDSENNNGTVRDDVMKAKSQRKRLIGTQRYQKSSDLSAEMSAEQRKVLVEQSIRELEVYNHTSNVLKARIAGLHSVKSSLLWLLKKASLHERNLIQQYGAVSHPSHT